MGLAIKHAVVLGLVLHPLEVEASVSKAALLLLKVHGVDGDELEVEDLYHVLIVSVDGSRVSIVVVRRVKASGVVVVLVLHLVGNLLVALFTQLIASQSLELLNRDALDVTRIHKIAEVVIFGVAVYEVYWVDVLYLNALVGVVASLYHTHTKSNQILDCSSKCCVVELRPRQSHVGGNLCRYLCVGLDVRIHEHLSFLKGLGDFVWIHVEYDARLLL